MVPWPLFTKSFTSLLSKAFLPRNTKCWLVSKTDFLSLFRKAKHKVSQNKVCCFFFRISTPKPSRKIETAKRHLLDVSSPNSYLFSSFRQFFFPFFLSVVWVSWNFVRFHEILFLTDAESFSFLSWKTKKFYT